MVVRIAKQTIAIIGINVRSIPRRLLISASASLSIALVVVILLGALALANGLSRALEGSGSDDVAIVLSQGASSEINSNITAEQQELLKTAPGVLQVAEQAAASPEMLVVVDGVQRSTGSAANLAFRGVSADGLRARRDIEISQGRMFTPGTDEIVVGSDLAETFEGFGLGETARIGVHTWRVVGVFEDDGSVFESEIWGDLPVLQALFNRGDIVQSVRLLLEDPERIDGVVKFSAADPRLSLDVKSERAFLQEQSEGVTDLITIIGEPLAIIMAIGAFVGAINAMSASTADRAKEISTLRAIGFGRLPTFLGTVVESLLLALIGAAAGTAIAILLFNGRTASTISGSLTQVAFDLVLTPEIILFGFYSALAVGALGGAIPAWKAARQPIFATEP